MTSPSEPNPYAPPAADIGEQSIAIVSASGDLASRWQRLGAALLDFLPAVGALVPFVIGVMTKALSGQPLAPAGGVNPLAPFLAAGRLGIISLVLLGAVAVTQWTLLGLRGQTFGKIVAGIRIVRLDGSRASFFRTVVARNWPFSICGLLFGNAGSVVGTVDALFVFRRDKRCLHDLMAGTKVVRVARNA